MNEKCGAKGHIVVRSCRCEIANEHENFLKAHRDNMKAVERIEELKYMLAQRDRVIEKYAQHIQKPSCKSYQTLRSEDCDCGYAVISSQNTMTGM